MPFSNEQRQAIETMGKNILVSASAGSGKTTVLIERMLHLIRDEKIPLDAILAMTFTDAAATEMKKRLNRELTKAIENSQDPQEIDYLSLQVASLAKANIMTIHSFCLRIVKQYYYILGLDADRVHNVVDSFQEATIKDACMKKCFEAYRHDPAFTELCKMFSARPETNDPLEKAIFDLFTQAQAKSDPLEYLSACKDAKEKHSLQDFDATILHYFFDRLQISIDIIQKDVLALLACYTAEKDIQKAQAKLDLLKKAHLALDHQDYGTFLDCIETEALIILDKIKEEKASEEIKKDIEKNEQALISLLFPEHRYVEAANRLSPCKNLFIDMTIAFTQEYDQAKEKANVMDFNDMEHFALAILKKYDGMVASLYRDHFEIILIDEFQDSNDVQDELAHLICRENNVFRVGDIKQSIYGFRHALPDIMKKMMDNPQENDVVLYLSNNYRSKKLIVDFNNALFAKLMNVEGFHCSFSKHDATTIGVSSQMEQEQKTELFRLDDKAINEGMEHKASKDELKASFIVHKIIELRQTKGYAYRDFVVLCRTNSKMNVLRKAFQDANIPHFIATKKGFFQSSALTNVLTFLKALNDPEDDLNFCALLLSPFFQFTDDQLATLQLNKEKQESYYSYCVKNDPQRFQDFIALKERCHYTSLSEIVETVLYTNNYYEDYASKQEKSNLDKFVLDIHQKEQQQALTIQSYLHMLSLGEKADIGETNPLSNEEDVVRIMTIHQSKGLQFPIVFLYSSTTISNPDTENIATYDHELGIGMQYIDVQSHRSFPTIERIAIDHKAWMALVEEEMRILYVALTRAQNHLMIVDTFSNETVGDLSRASMVSKNGYTIWILQALQKRSDLLDIHWIEEAWTNVAMPSMEAQAQTIPKYTLPIQSTTVLLPSQMESEVQTLPAFNPAFYRAAKHGTSLHKMVQCLPNTEWSDALLQTIAKKEHLDLTKHDRIVLHALNQNDVFQQTFNAKVHKEYPFLVQKDTTMIHGFIDYLAEFEDHLILIDFKSNHHVTPESLIQQYHAQIETYVHALGLLYPYHTLEAYLYSFELMQMIPIEL